MTTVDTVTGAATDVSLARIAADAPGRAGPGERVAFMGDRGAFLRLVVKGGLLLIATFGFYRFWLATSVRRRLWSATRIGGEPLEWVGTGRELLVGFLIALAVLAPIYLGYFLLGLLAETWQAFASVPLAFLLSVLGHYAAFRARRYRATRTALRGLRFWMTGSGIAYTWRASLWDLAVLLTLGLAYPWRAASLERYRMRHTHYGTLEGRFEGTGWTFFRRGWWLWALGLAWLAASGVAGVLVTLAMTGQAASPERVAVAWGGALLPALAALGAFAYPAFIGIEARWRLDGMRFGPITLSSDLRPGTVVWRYCKLIAVCLAYALFGLPIIMFTGAVVSAAFGGAAPEGAASILVGFVVGLVYLLSITGFGAIKQRFLDFGLWESIAGSITLHGLSALDDVVARGAPASSLGEGLADALDVGGF